MMLTSEMRKQIEENNIMLDSCIEIMKTLGSQGLAARGNDETFNPDKPHKNRGNYAALLTLVSKHNPVVKKFLDQPSKQGTTTLASKTILEELIKITGEKIAASIFNEVIESGMYVIIADEVTVFNTQYLVLCLRYVSKTDGQVHESFVSYMEMTSGKAEPIFNLLVQELQEGGLDLSKYEFNYIFVN